MKKKRSDYMFVRRRWDDNITMELQQWDGRGGYGLD